MTPCVALEALNMLEPLLFFLQLELFFIGATICKMSHFIAFEAHKMRELLLFLLLHLSFISSLAPSVALDLALVEFNATHVTIAPFVVQHMLEGDMRVVAPL
jgi:hypothetical protein